MTTTTRAKLRRKLANTALIFFLGVAFLCFFSALWYTRTYGRTGFDSVLSTLTAGLSGAQAGLYLRYLLGGALPAAVCTAALGFLLFYPLPRLHLKRWLQISISLVLSLGLIVFAAFHSELVDYIIANSQNSTIYENSYRDPDDVSITFPEEKRNLVYIILESMEWTFADTENGGAMDTNRIPELTALAQENVNFSQSSGVGGFQEIPGATWTIGSLVAQTSGVPLKVPSTVADGNSYGYSGEFLPGITTLQNVLHDNGYTQALMVGSDASFAGRDTYYSTHGTDYIWDLHTARYRGVVYPEYYVWWGLEDMRLYDYAKLVLSEMAAEEGPFAFSLLTVDTHHVGGYKCELCTDEYSEQYENVYACASRQLAAFISWLQEQPFYENTTVVIVGDHRSMDSAYFKYNVEESYVRRMYNCFLNAAAEPQQAKNREFTTVDLFPTTLAALGCTIEGDRLGLGVNLFSGEQTLTEEKGYEAFCNELAKASRYYIDNFF